MILSSIFRDSAHYLHRYGRQVADLAEHVELHVLVAVGDDSDGTRDLLDKALSGVRHTILRVDHGGPRFRSVDEAARWRQIALVCNCVANAVSWEIRDCEKWVYVESDLIWEPETILALADHDVDAVAPLSLCNDGTTFYDTWGYVGVDGPFAKHPPYSPGNDGTLFPIKSAGSCIVMSDWLARVVTFGERDCVRGLGRSIEENGGTLVCDPNLAVIHP